MYRNWFLLLFMLTPTIRFMTTTNAMSTLKPVTSSSNSSSVSSKPKKLIFHWFRHGDLRLHDNPALIETCKLASSSSSKNGGGGGGAIILPIFCFDDTTIFGNTCTTPTGDLKCNTKRAKFIIESVQDLQSNIQQTLKTNLLITRGNPSHVFTTILEHLNIQSQQADNNNNNINNKIYSDITVVCQEEVVKEEKDACKAVLDVIQKMGGPKSKLISVWGSTMYELKDLPYNDRLEDMPDVFTPFRNKVEKTCTIPRPVSSPTDITLFQLPSSSKETSSSDADIIQQLIRTYNKVPTLHELGYTSEQIEYANMNDSRGVMEFKGGETAALQRLNDYIWKLDCLKDYFDTRNGMIGPNYSTKLSPWLAHGCISPRTIAIECQKYEKQRIQNKSTYWVIFELLWRDYCKFLAYKYGDAIFYPGGTIDSKKTKWNINTEYIEAWKQGKTGYPLVDANIREMLATGFMSNRGRQNVASFIAIDLAQDWRIGGNFFESNLIDYDVYSNWVNWCSAAGMTGGRLNRFNIVKQSKDYDQHGDYVRLWCPELKNVPTEFVHEPWKMTHFQQIEYKVNLGVDYPMPIISPSAGRDNANNNGMGDSNRKGHRQQMGKQRKPNPAANNGKNRGQKYEMKSVKTGKYNI